MISPNYYVARNKDNTLSLFGMRPIRGEDMWQEKCCSYIEELDPDYFADLRWEDPPLRCDLQPVGDIYA